MELEEALRAGVEVTIFGKTEVGAALWRRWRHGAVVIDRQRLEPNQGFRVMLLGLLGFERFTGDEVVDGVDPRCRRMSPGDTLHGSQTAKSERVSRWIHADVRVEQDVQFQVCHEAADVLEILGKL